ncbi:MAG TPA: non-homologous end-joining DNA ligase, partial [Planctomycetaceae bacterium]
VIKRVEIKEKDGVNTYLVISNVEGLVTLVQFGAIEIHAWGARIDEIEKPDRLIFDLDPDTAVDWPDVIETALHFRRVLSDLGLVSFVKTTGGKGLHVVIPVDRRRDWKTVKSFCKSLAERIAAAAPDHFTTNPLKAQRRGKIFIDYLRNERGATAVAPYSCRARAGAPVATPVSWAELRTLSGPQEFTLQNLPARLSRKRRDPWAEISRSRQSLPAATGSR